MKIVNKRTHKYHNVISEIDGGLLVVASQNNKKSTFIIRKSELGPHCRFRVVQLKESK